MILYANRICFIREPFLKHSAVIPFTDTAFTIISIFSEYQLSFSTHVQGVIRSPCCFCNPIALFVTLWCFMSCVYFLGFLMFCPCPFIYLKVWSSIQLVKARGNVHRYGQEDKELAELWCCFLTNPFYRTSTPESQSEMTNEPFYSFCLTAVK